MLLPVKKTFSFLDESGFLVPRKNFDHNFYGVALIKHTEPNSIIQRLHKAYEGLVSALQREESRLEFSFKSITRKVFHITLRI